MNIRRARNTRFVFVPLRRVIEECVPARAGQSEHAHSQPAMVALARVFTSSHSEQSR